MRLAACGAALAGAALLGCGTTSTADDFGDVQRLVAERTGQRLSRWSGTQPDAELDAAVSRLLHDHSMSVGEAVQVALVRNPRLQALYEEIGVAQADLVQAGLLRNPVFDAALRWGSGSPDVDLAVTQEFLDVLFVPFRSAVAKSRLEATKARVAEGVLAIDGETREAFWRLQAEMQLLEMRQQVRTATSAAFDAATALHEAGNVPDLDVDAQRVLLDRALVAVAASQSAVASARERLNVAMGVWGADASWSIESRLPPVPPGMPDLGDLEKRAVAANLVLARLREEVLATAQEAELAGATRGVDDVAVGATAERDDGEWSVGPSLRLPIPLFDQGQARGGRALARLRQREMELRAAAIEVRAAVRAAAQRLATARDTAVFHRDEVLPTAARIVDATQRRHNAMQVGVFQLLEAKRNEIDAGQAYVESLRDYWLARNALEQILRGRIPPDAFASAEAPLVGDDRTRR